MLVQHSASVQTRDICVTFGGNRGPQHRPCFHRISDLGIAHISSMVPDVPMTSGGSPGHSDQHPPPPWHLGPQIFTLSLVSTQTMDICFPCVANSSYRH